MQMFERQMRAKVVVQNDVRDTFDVAMTGNGDGRNLQLPL